MGKVCTPLNSRLEIKPRTFFCKWFNAIITLLHVRAFWILIQSQTTFPMWIVSGFGTWCPCKQDRASAMPRDCMHCARLIGHKLKNREV